jgi:hypothetical protein
MSENKDITDLLPVLPENYFWRIGKSGSEGIIIDDRNQVQVSTNCVILSIRKNKHFFKFNFSILIETKGLIYVGKDLSRLSREAETMHNAFQKKLEASSEANEIDMTTLYVGDYLRAKKANRSFKVSPKTASKKAISTSI